MRSNFSKIIKTLNIFILTAVMLSFYGGFFSGNAQAAVEHDTLYDLIEGIGEVNYDNYLDKKPSIDFATAKSNELIGGNPDYEWRLPNLVHNYLKLVEIKEKVDYYMLADSIGLLAELSATKACAAGDTITATLKLKNLRLTSLNNISYVADYNPLLMESQNAQGEISTLLAGEIATKEINFTVKEGGFTPVSVRVYYSGGSVVTPKVQIFIDSRGFFFMDGHTHSIQSDGRGSIAWNMWDSIRKGSNVMYATDHDAIAEIQRDVELAREIVGLTGYDNFILQKGNEITGIYAAGHALNYNVQRSYTAPNSVKKMIEVLNSTIKEGSIFYVAHPFFPNLEFEPLNMFNINTIYGFTGIEIMNGAQAQPENYETNTAPEVTLWDMLNLKGEKKYFAVSNSDSHNPAGINKNRNGLLLDEFTQNNVNNVLSNGKFFCTNGPELRFTLDGKEMGESVIISGGKQVPVNITVRSQESPLLSVVLVKYKIDANGVEQGLATQEKTMLFDDATGTQGKNFFTFDSEISIAPGEFYRVEATAKRVSSLVRKAYSNPIWVTPATNKFKFDKDKVYMQPGETTRLTWQLGNVYDTISVTSSDKKAVEVLDNGFVRVSADAVGSYTVTGYTQSGKVSTCNIIIGEDPGPQATSDWVLIAAITGAVVVAAGGVAVFIIKRKKQGT